MSLVARIDALVPRWMLTAPRQAMGLLMAGLGGLLDGLAEAVFQARLAAIPGQVDPPGVPGLGGFDSCDALPMIARDRAVTPGISSWLSPYGVGETPAQLAARCRAWLDDAAAETGPFGVLDALAAVLVPSAPVLRLVVNNDSLTSWYTREADGTRRLQRTDGVGFFLAPDGTSGVDTTMAANWNWDFSTSPQPPDAGDTSRFWIIAYPPLGGIYLTTTDGTCQNLGICGDLWDQPLVQAVGGSPWAGTCGTNAPIELAEMMRNVIRSRRAAGNVCAYIVIAFDLASFNPDGSSTGSPSAYPDGTWGYASKTEPSTHTRVPARLGTAEYFPGAPGGRAP